jgi:hypothetical protein
MLVGKTDGTLRPKGTGVYPSCASHGPLSQEQRTIGDLTANGGEG